MNTDRSNDEEKRSSVEAYRGFEEAYRAKIFGFEKAYREAEGKVSPAEIMRRLGKQCTLRIKEKRKQRNAMELMKRENEHNRRRQRTVKIDSIAFGILSITMTVWTGVCMCWFFGKIY
jgi:hypothetical protein